MATSAEIQSQIDALKAASQSKAAELKSVNQQSLEVNKQLRALKAAGQTSSPEYAALSQQYTNLEYQSLNLNDAMNKEAGQINDLTVELRDAKEAEDDAKKEAAAAQAQKEKEQRKKTKQSKNKTTSEQRDCLTQMINNV